MFAVWEKYGTWPSTSYFQLLRAGRQLLDSPKQNIALIALNDESWIRVPKVYKVVRVSVSLFANCWAKSFSFVYWQISFHGTEICSCFFTMSSHERFEQLNFKFFSGKSFQSAESDLLRTKRVGKVFEPTGAGRRSKQNTSQNQSSSSSQTLFESSIHDSSKSGWERKSEPWWISSTCRQQVHSLKKFILQNKIVQHCWQKGCLLCQFTTSSRSFKFSFVKYKGLLFHLRPRWTKSNLKRKKVTLDVFYICALFYLLDVI